MLKLKPYTILVTDDDQDIRDGIEIYLKNDGYNVLKAANGLEALELLMEHEVHLIILDIMMPKLDGIQTTFKIREERNIPIIMDVMLNWEPTTMISKEKSL